MRVAEPGTTADYQFANPPYALVKTVALTSGDGVVTELSGLGKVAVDFCGRCR